MFYGGGLLIRTFPKVSQRIYADKNCHNNLVALKLIHIALHRLHTVFQQIFTSVAMLCTKLTFFTQLLAGCAQVFVQKRSRTFFGGMRQMTVWGHGCFPCRVRSIVAPVTVRHLTKRYDSSGVDKFLIPSQDRHQTFGFTLGKVLPFPNNSGHAGPNSKLSFIFAHS